MASRVAQPQKSLHGVQILRGVAALAVLLHHVLEESAIFFQPQTLPEPLVIAGASGVDLFFVISGFIMLYTCEGRFGQPGAAGDFLLRRLIRIVPLYWLCTLAVLALALTGAFYKAKIITAGATFNSLFFLPTDHLLLGVGWTLQYEMYFYLIFAGCLSLGTAGLTIFALPLTLSIMIVIGQFLPAGPAQVFFSNPIALEFSFGIWLAYLYSRDLLPKINPWLVIFLGCAGIAISAIFAPSDGTSGLAPQLRFLAWGVPALMIVYAGLSVGRVSSRAGRLLPLLGNASYSIYLTHAIVMTSYAKLIKTESFSHYLPPLAWMAVAVAVALAIGIATYKLVEQPANNWLKSRWRAQGGAVAA